MIVIAAIFIVSDAVGKLVTGVDVQQLGLGTALTAGAGAVNGALGAYLVWTGRKRRSLVLEANGKHVLTDCWTIVGVVVGLTLAIATGWLYWDPIAALLVATNILISGLSAISRSFSGEDYKYELLVRPRKPNFKVSLGGANPTVNAGSGFVTSP